MRALHLIYAFFLGLAVVGFVAIGLDTFYPGPEYPFPVGGNPDSGPAFEAYQAAQDAWNLTTSIVLLVAATVILVVSLLLAERWIVLTNGLLLGGLFTLVYAVGRSLSDDSVIRFVVIAAALAVTIAVGWFKFARTQQPAPGAAGSPGGAEPGSGSVALEHRVAALEQRIEALRRALGS